MNHDSTLLRCYAEEKTEAAFAELVRRNIGLVYAVALRRVNGDASLAEEVAQGVFTDLARKASSLAGHPALGAWLFRSARFAAGHAMRGEKRRELREQEAHLMEEIAKDAAPDPDWNQLRPLLDDVMDELPERDRVAVWLRVCEGRPFAEISERLAASEDAVRVRVNRAIEKMRDALVRRGIISTTAALTSALARDAGMVAPVGFAASVTGAALASVAAAGGIAAGLGISTLMSTTKIGAWGVTAAILFASLAGNAYLLTREPPPIMTPATVITVAATIAEGEPTAVSRSLVKSANLATLRDQLRATGQSEASIRAMLEGILRRRYREKLSLDRAERLARGWWRDPQRTWGTSGDGQRLVDDSTLLREMVTQPLEKLLGPDPLDVSEAEARYAFLPSELRQAFGRLDREAPTGFSTTGQPDIDATNRADYERQRASAENHRKELLAAFTPEQRADWEMRISPFATGLARQLEQAGVTEVEFRTVFPIAVEFMKQMSAARTKPDEQDVARHRVMEKLVAALGYDRALDYIWAGTMEYPAYARVARDADLPGNRAGHVIQLAAETAEQAASIHADIALTVAQKRAALVTLQQVVKLQLDTLLPPAAQQRISPNALTWFTTLGEGSYKPIGVVLPGQVNMMTMTVPISVDAPRKAGPRQPNRAQLMPSRPNGIQRPSL